MLLHKYSEKTASSLVFPQLFFFVSAPLVSLIYKWRGTVRRLFFHEDFLFDPYIYTFFIFIVTYAAENSAAEPRWLGLTVDEFQSHCLSLSLACIPMAED